MTSGRDACIDVFLPDMMAKAKLCAPEETIKELQELIADADAVEVELRPLSRRAVFVVEPARVMTKLDRRDARTWTRRVIELGASGAVVDHRTGKIGFMACPDREFYIEDEARAYAEKCTAAAERLAKKMREIGDTVESVEPARVTRRVTFEYMG